MTTQLKAIRGDQTEFLFAITRDGSPLDITNAQEIWFTVKSKIADADVDAVWQGTLTAADIAITDGPAGELTVTIPGSAFTALTSERRLKWDLQLKESDGRINTPVMGTITVLMDVTLST